MTTTTAAAAAVAAAAQQLTASTRRNSQHSLAVGVLAVESRHVCTSSRFRIFILQIVLGIQARCKYGFQYFHTIIFITASFRCLTSRYYYRYFACRSHVNSDMACAACAHTNPAR